MKYIYIITISIILITLFLFCGRGLHRVVVIDPVDLESNIIQSVVRIFMNRITTKTSSASPIVDLILECESNNRHTDRNGNLIVGDRHLYHKAYGIAQFQERTFKWLSKLANRTDLKIENEQDQIWLLNWSIQNGFGYLWACYSKVATK